MDAERETEIGRLKIEKNWLTCVGRAWSSFYFGFDFGFGFGFGWWTRIGEQCCG